MEPSLFRIDGTQCPGGGLANNLWMTTVYMVIKNYE